MGAPCAEGEGQGIPVLSLDENGLSFSLKLPMSGAAALTLPFTEPTHYGLGKHGWVTATLPEGKKAPLELFEAWLRKATARSRPRSWWRNPGQARIGIERMEKLGG